MKHFSILIAAMLLLPAGAQESGGILFLHLRLDGDQVRVVSQARTPGTLKSPRGAGEARGLKLQLNDAAGAELWSGSVADPSFRRLEYEDPDEPGRLKVREVTITNAEFTVRVPAHPRGRQLKVSRVVSSGNRAKAPELKNLGTVEIEPVVEAP